MAKAKRLTPKQIEAIIAEASEGWLERHDEAGIRAWVLCTLDKARDQILHAGLGFERSWNEWRIDHCNGRMSVISNHIEKTAMEAARQWLTEQCGALPELNKQQIAAIRSEYLTAYWDSLRANLRELAKQRAGKRAAELLAHYTAETEQPTGAKA
jgi:hypothetical protein